MPSQLTDAERARYFENRCGELSARVNDLADAERQLEELLEAVENHRERLFNPRHEIHRRLYDTAARIRKECND